MEVEELTITGALNIPSESLMAVHWIAEIAGQ